jgi:hypothetical protein
MDFHLTKPLEERKMLEVILSIVNEWDLAAFRVIH